MNWSRLNLQVIRLFAFVTWNNLRLEILMTKYACLQNGCNFITENEVEAIEHFEQSNFEHKIVEISKEKKLTCHLLNQ